MPTKACQQLTIAQQSHTPLQGLAAPRLSQSATKHPCPNHPRFPRNTSSPASRQQTCARKSSTSSNAVISKSTWPLAPRRESQSVPIPKTRRSITINAAQIAKDNKVRLFEPTELGSNVANRTQYWLHGQLQYRTMDSGGPR